MGCRTMAYRCKVQKKKLLDLRFADDILLFTDLTVAILAQAQAFVLFVALIPRRLGTMPLSQIQLEALKNPATIIQIQPDNPKKPGSKAFERFDRYKTATTIGDATSKGANWQDLTTDFEKEFLKIPDLMPVDEVQNEELQQEPPTEKQMRGAKCILPPPWFPRF